MTNTGVFERAARNDRIVILAALVAAAALALWATLRSGDALMRLAPHGPVSVATVALLFAMWWSMMLAMMLAAVAPAILMFAAMNRKLAASTNQKLTLFVFVAGYAAIWTLFSLAATTLQILSHDVIPLTGMMAVVSQILGGLLMLAAGIYQFTPLKNACLRQCQSPLSYFARHWRSGMPGAFRMGLDHGIYCLGCCWVLMGLLFYGGVMQPLWIIALALYVAIEKLVPAKHRFGQFAGTILIAFGSWTIVRALA